ncbi:TPA: amino acid adenylation domain-containing protein, partial [Staphylococcus aureus]|nr:amino acid adenylation domain-containing protein [Staphylococcus aureus]HCX2391192.1 amino acid adenylation domain-containing protein [Staphylococcus aureus]HCX3078963.1 amino acid adenylation domain-containing protein [Staphylococcus aureus]HCX3212034.1 amino acid adenylation domain-containing protein [Staphylococcus aureus]HCX3662276.1 amino acid adenylation domain-containing protein [Staphylococcus aureus]
MIMGNLRFQQEYFRIYKNNTESTTHRNAYWVKLAKNVEATKMMYALSTIVQQHASIRHFFDVTTDDHLTMILHEFLPFIEIKQVPSSSANYDLEAFFKQELSTYHFNDSPLFKFKLFQFADATYILLDFHVSIFDGSQIDIFLDDLCNAYRGNTVINNTRQHAHLNRNDDKDNQDASHIALDSNYFRLEKNSDIHIDSYLPIKHPFEQALYQTYLIDDMTSIDMASLAVSVYLANHIMSQQHDVTLGIHVPSHLPNDLHGNIVPLTLTIDAKDVCQRFTTDFNKCVLQNMSQLQCAKSSLSLETIFHCYHQMMPCCNDVIEDVHQIHDAHTSLADIEIFPYQHGFKIIYNSAAYDLLSIETLSDLVRNIYLQITEENGNKRITVDELNLMTERDIQLYDDINLSLPDLDDAQTVVTLFEQQVEATPNHVAVQFDGVFITYQTLNARANDLAHRLRNQYGVEPNDRVAVIAEKSIEMIIAMIGVLKAGGAYVPIDPNYPSDRQEYILKDATPKVVITYQALYENSKQNINHIDLNKIAWKNIDNLSECNTLEDHAYVIYTSGTTGNPKGTLIPHRGIVRLVHQNHYVPLNEETTILLSGTIAFDAATFEIYGALLNGGKLIVAKKEQLLNPIVLEQLINENDVNTMWLTSSLFNQIASERIEVLVPLKYLLIGGEVLNAKWVDLLNQRPKHPQIINGYGPTENTTFTTTYNIPNKVPNRIPIGKPILGTHVYIMQGERRCGVGIPGELCTSGFGLAAGYLNQPELTADKFIKDSNINQLMYRSGDIVRLLPDGNIDYLYRKDKQVKIRGFRIELSEVEHALER